MRRSGSSRVGRYVVALLVVVGAAIRIRQFAANPSLWLDEVAVARNVVDRPLWPLLTTPLAADLTVPKGFLLAEKLATLVLGTSDLALRALPCAASLLALVGFGVLALGLLDELAAVAAVLLFALAVPLVSFSCQVKPYAFDVAVAVAVLGVATMVDHRRATAASLVGAAGVWCSQPAMMVVVGVGLALAWRARREGTARDVAPVLLWWGASTLAAGLVAAATLSARARPYLEWYWKTGFPSRTLPVPWPVQPLHGLFGSAGTAGLGYPLPGVYLALAAAGLFGPWRRSDDARIVGAPIGLAMLAAALHQYPFADRAILFLVPGLLLLVGAGVGRLARAAAARVPSAGWIVLGLLLTPAVGAVATAPPPYAIEDVKPILERLAGERQPGDRVYVYYGAVPTLAFHAAAYGLHERDYAAGGCHRGETRAYLAEIDTFRNQKRVWIVMTHGWSHAPERDDILRYLDAIGERRSAFVVQVELAGSPYTPAELFLYDLSDPARLAAADAASFPTGRVDADPGFGCDLGPIALAPAGMRSPWERDVGPTVRLPQAGHPW